MIYPKLGEKARTNGHVVYSLDFEVTPHMLRHTYITNLIHASVDPKTVQYLAGHESSKITMDIYAKVKYNKPEQLAGVLSGAFAEWDGGEYEAAQYFDGKRTKGGECSPPFAFPRIAPLIEP